MEKLISNGGEELVRYTSFRYTVNVKPSPSLVAIMAWVERWVCVSQRREERCHTSGTQKEIQVLSGLLQHPLRDTNMQSEISEEVDMGTALLRTWSFAICERVHSEKVSVFHCINVSDLEVRGREEMGGGASTGNFILWQKNKNILKAFTKCIDKSKM